jgi:hypothetical protein
VGGSIVMAAEGVSVISYFMPIFAFMLVFIIIFSLLKATQVLGDAPIVLIFVSFILSSFFIVEASLIEFVTFSGSWISVGFVVLFFLFLIMAFIPGVGGLEGLGKFLGAEGTNWFAWVILAGVISLFIISSAYVFNWVVDWELLQGWVNTEWFGFILLLIVAGVVSWKMTLKPL